jgi:hypothetical protein
MEKRSSRVTRGETILQKITDAHAISPTAKDWLIASLDPMHDNQLPNLQGWPDLEGNISVVSCIKQSETILSPSSTDNWDCDIVLWPWLEQVQFASKQARNCTLGNTIATALMGGVQVWTPLTGSDLDLAATPSPVSITLDPSFVNGASRIIGVGIEVVNTTSNLNKQGQAFVWRQSSGAGGQAMWSSQDAIAPQIRPFLGHMQRRPPANTAQAMKIPGTQQWRAEDGVYIQGTFVGQDNPPLYTCYDLPVVYDNALAEDSTTVNYGVPTYNDRVVWVPQETVPDPSFGFVPPCMKMNPLHMSGAYFTGLSPQSSLTLTVNYYLESFPGPAEPQILVLGTPSAQYDPVALEIFSHCMRTLPVGVMAGENPFGEWFADVVRQVANYIYPVARAFAPRQVANVIRGVGRAAEKNQQYMATQSPNQIPRRKNDALPPIPVNQPNAVAKNAARKDKKKRSRNRANPST